MPFDLPNVNDLAEAAKDAQKSVSDRIDGLSQEAKNAALQMRELVTQQMDRVETSQDVKAATDLSLIHGNHEALVTCLNGLSPEDKAHMSVEDQAALYLAVDNQYSESAAKLEAGFGDRDMDLKGVNIRSFDESKDMYDKLAGLPEAQKKAWGDWAYTKGKIDSGSYNPNIPASVAALPLKGEFSQETVLKDCMDRNIAILFVRSFPNTPLANAELLGKAIEADIRSGLMSEAQFLRDSISGRSPSILSNPNLSSENLKAIGDAFVKIVWRGGEENPPKIAGNVNGETVFGVYLDLTQNPKTPPTTKDAIQARFGKIFGYNKASNSALSS